MLKNKFNSENHTEKSSLNIFSKKRFDSLSRIQQNLCHTEKKLNSVSHIQEKKFRFSSHIQKRFNSLSQKLMKILQLFESYSKKGSILWVMSKKRRIQLLWVMLERRVQFRESHGKMVQFRESCFSKKKTQFFESSK